MSVKGGRGSQNGGGGGAGGRFVMNYRRSYLGSSYPDQSFYWTGTEDISGGAAGFMPERYMQPSEGQNGTLFGTKCMPGYSGVFCKACPVGTFKYDYSYADCLPC